MIGDSYTNDIEPSLKVGWKTFFFNIIGYEHDIKECTMRIDSLEDLKNIEDVRKFDYKGEK